MTAATARCAGMADSSTAPPPHLREEAYLPNVLEHVFSETEIHALCARYKAVRLS